MGWTTSFLQKFLPSLLNISLGVSDSAFTFCASSRNSMELLKVAVLPLTTDEKRKSFESIRFPSDLLEDCADNREMMRKGICKAGFARYILSPRSE
jgi:hypothetical protein